MNLWGKSSSTDNTVAVIFQVLSQYVVIYCPQAASLAYPVLTPVEDTLPLKCLQAESDGMEDDRKNHPSQRTNVPIKCITNYNIKLF